MYPNNFRVPNAGHVAGTQPAAGPAHQPAAAANYSGHTIGPTADGQQRFMVPTQSTTAGSTNPFRAESQAGIRAFEQGPAEFTPDQWRGIRSILGGPMEGSLWLAHRLAALSNYELDFIIDNSLSMNQRDGMRDPETGLIMSRLEEAIHRLGNIADLLSYIPVKGITLRTLSGDHTPVVIGCHAPPHEIAGQIKDYLESVKRSPRTSNTPLYTALATSLNENRDSPDPRIIYVLNDGKPNSGGGPADVCQLLGAGRCGEKNPVCLIACTDDRKSIAWMKDADEIAENIHVVDDFESEKRKIKAKQGHKFPVTEGFYGMSSLLGAIDDLFDKADENHIYSHNHYQEIMGRMVPEAEYEAYRREASLLQSGEAEKEAGYDNARASFLGHFLGFR